MRSRFRPHLTSPKSLSGIYTAPWTVPIMLDDTGCPGHCSRLFIVFLGVLQQPAELWAENIRGWYVKKLDTKLMGQGFPWESHIKPPPFPCLTLTTNSQVCSNNPSSTLLWGCFFFLNKLLFGWWGKKTDGGWLVCETVTLYYQPTCWGPKQCTLNQVWWFNVLFVQGQKLIDGMCAHPWPDLSHCWHKCDWLLELFWDVAGWTCNCFIWQQGLYVKKGKWQCVWLMLQ